MKKIKTKTERNYAKQFERNVRLHNNLHISFPNVSKLANFQPNKTALLPVGSVRWCQSMKLYHFDVITFDK